MPFLSVITHPEPSVFASVPPVLSHTPDLYTGTTSLPPFVLWVMWIFPPFFFAPFFRHFIFLLLLPL